ncbi:dynein regulatory complex protein 1 [Cololabis saira]|uniref:dynein regulatory complex protein 1 n=1 Tax=Cololabis saira TaxID=129043 RepID=UPI002AD3D5E9|nr:dynein regulatory complex protein 1 [Cololabis saira]
MSREMSQSRSRRDEDMEERQKSIFNLQGQLKRLVTDVQITADARVQKTHQDKGQALRSELLENHLKSSQEQFEKISKGWTLAHQKVFPHDLQEVLDTQRETYATLTEAKKKLINNLQQDLKKRDKRYVNNLKKNTEETDQMFDRIRNQNKTLIKAYKEELAQTEKVRQQEIEVLLTNDNKWEQDLKEHWDKEFKRLMEEMEMNEEEFRNKVLEVINIIKIHEFKREAKRQDWMRLDQRVEVYCSDLDSQALRVEPYLRVQLATIKTYENKIRRPEKESEIKQKESIIRDKQFTKEKHMLSEDYKKHKQKYELRQPQIKYFANVDLRNFEKIWLLTEAEVKQLLERALVIDSLICKQYLDVAWKRPNVPSLELFGPTEPQKQLASSLSPPFETEKCCPETDTDTESPCRDIFSVRPAAQQQSSPKREEGKSPNEALKKVMELLCDKADFLMEEEVLKMLSSMEKEQQTAVKLGSLFSSLGIGDEDVPKLVDFLIKYEQQQREQTEDACLECSGLAEGMETSVTTTSTPDLVHPNHVLPALKSFVEQRRRSRESAAQQLSSFLNVDTSEDKAYWESLGNIISEDELKRWDAAERTLNRYHVMLREISDLTPKMNT